MSEGSGINDDSSCTQAGLVDPVDELELRIGLAKLDLQAQICTCPSACRLDVRQCFAAIDFGLSAAEQIQVWAVQDVDDWPHFFLSGIAR